MRKGGEGPHTLADETGGRAIAARPLCFDDAFAASSRCGILGRMKGSYTAVIERDPETGLLIGYIPGWPGAHSQGQTLDELRENLREVVEMLLEDGPPKLEGEFVGTQLVTVE